MIEKNSLIDAIVLLTVGFIMVALMLGTAHAATTNKLLGVMINDAGETRPAQSIATPGQVQAVSDAALTAYDVSVNAQEIAVAAKAIADACRAKTVLYGSNYMWSSRAYCEGVGAVNFDPSNQVMQITWFTVGETNIIVRGVALQSPLVGAPVLDFRATMGTSGVWTNLATYSVTEIAVPAAYSGYAKAYEYNIAKPAGTSIFVRMRDSSSGMSGSGWVWLVYGDIIVNKDGKYYRGKTGLESNIWTAASIAYTNVIRWVSGLNCNFEPLGE